MAGVAAPIVRMCSGRSATWSEASGCWPPGHGGNRVDDGVQHHLKQLEEKQRDTIQQHPQEVGKHEATEDPKQELLLHGRWPFLSVLRLSTERFPAPTSSTTRDLFAGTHAPRACSC